MKNRAHTSFVIGQLTVDQLRVLLAVCQLYSSGRPVTVRAVHLFVGFGSRGAIYNALRILRDRKLVEWEWGRRATLRPNCTVSIESQKGNTT